MKLFQSILFLLSVNSISAKNTDYLPSPTTNLIKHTYYTLSYNEPNEQANWVYYTLTDSMVINSNEERSNNFKIDKLVLTGSAKSSDYTKSGYDRGHLCPAADMGFNPTAMTESFLMSNISPQTPDFNRGIWKELETTVREWAKKEKQLKVLTGPIFSNNKGHIGTNEVVIPGYYFKIIYDTTDNPRLIAFVIPNEKSDRPLTDFAVTTDKVEELTGYDFFAQLPNELEDKLEKSVELSGWFEGYDAKDQIAAKSIQQEAKSDFNIYLLLILGIAVIAIIVYVKGRKR